MNKEFTGVIERLFVNDRKTAKGNKKSISIANNKIYYGLGLHDTDTYQVNGVTLKEGMEVSFSYEDGKYKNVVLDTLKIVKTEPIKEVKKAKDDKDLGMRLGNAVTISTHLTKSHLDIVPTAKQVLPLVDEFRNRMANKYPEMQEYAIGSRVGQVSIIAAQFTANIDSFIETAEQLFEELCLAEEELKNPAVKSVENEKVQQPFTETTDEVVGWSEDIPF